jgi:hypothetical protein
MEEKLNFSLPEKKEKSSSALAVIIIMLIVLIILLIPRSLGNTIIQSKFTII